MANKINGKKVGRTIWEGTKIVVEMGTGVGSQVIVNSVLNAMTPSALGPVANAVWKAGTFGITLATGFIVMDKTEELLDDIEFIVLNSPKALKDKPEMEVVK